MEVAAGDTLPGGEQSPVCQACVVFSFCHGESGREKLPLVSAELGAQQKECLSKKSYVPLGQAEGLVRLAQMSFLSPSH